MKAEIIVNPQTFDRVLLLRDGDKRVQLALEYLMDAYYMPPEDINNTVEDVISTETKNQILSRAVSNIKRKLGDV